MIVKIYYTDGSEGKKRMAIMKEEKGKDHSERMPAEGLSKWADTSEIAGTRRL